MKTVSVILLTIFVLNAIPAGAAEWPHTYAMSMFSKGIAGNLAVVDQELQVASPNAISKWTRYWKDSRTFANENRRAGIKTYTPVSNYYLDSIAKRLLKASGLESRADNGRGYGIHVSITKDGWDTGYNFGYISIAAPAIMRAQHEDEIAVLVAHELSHHLLEHAVRFSSDSERDSSLDTNKGWETYDNDKFLAYRKKQEIEADVLSSWLLYNAGYNLKYLPLTWSWFDIPEGGEHPPTTQRLSYLKAIARALGTQRFESETTIPEVVKSEITTKMKDQGIYPKWYEPWID